jgi:hypothetical protein
MSLQPQQVIKLFCSFNQGVLIFTFADMDALPGFPRIAFRPGTRYQSRIEVFTSIDPVRYLLQVSDIHDPG